MKNLQTKKKENLGEQNETNIDELTDEKKDSSKWRIFLFYLDIIKFIWYNYGAK